MIISHLHFVSLPAVLTVSASAALPADGSKGSFQKKIKKLPRRVFEGWQLQIGAICRFDAGLKKQTNDRLIKGNNTHRPGRKLYSKVDLTSLLSFHPC